MGLVAVVAAVGLWAGVVVVYGVLAYFLLFYLPPSEQLPNGNLADVAFVVTAPLVLAVTWLAGARRG